VKSLRAQLTLRLLCGGALLLGAAGVALDWEMRRALTAHFDAALAATVHSLTLFVEQKIDGAKLEREGATLPQFAEADSSDVYLLRTSDGREVKRSPSLGDATLPLRAGPPKRPVFFDAALPDGRVLRCEGLRFLPKMTRKVRERNAPGVEVVFIVGRDRAPLDRTLARLRGALLVVGAGALAGLAVLVRFGVRGGLSPLDRLGEAVAGVDATSLATRFPAESLPTELRPIATRLNELLARLENAFAREQRFTATAAHELRTPLAELRALAEVNLTTPATKAERAESWQDALATTRRMEALALRLLDLTRCEDPARVIRREPVALAEAVAESWRPWTARAAEQGVALDSALPADLQAHTDAALLAIILGNLCGNAVEHATEGEPLRVTAARDSSAITLSFRNRAGTLTAADMPHVFERFWRKDGARAGSEHHGLGLALAAEFAAVLGGSLSARLDDGNVEFALRLPAA
jgi:two-component system sensor histidine kinase QseC